MPTIQFYGKRRVVGAEIVICHPPICRHIGLLPLAGILPPKLLYLLRVENETVILSSAVLTNYAD